MAIDGRSLLGGGTSQGLQHLSLRAPRARISASPFSNAFRYHARRLSQSATFRFAASARAAMAPSGSWAAVRAATAPSRFSGSKRLRSQASTPP